MVIQAFALVLILGASASDQDSTQAKPNSNSNFINLLEDSDAINQFIIDISQEIPHENKSHDFPKKRQLYTCTSGSAGCLACASLSLCGTCSMAGYLPNPYGGCFQSSLSHCDVVYTQNSCQVCSTGYYLECAPCSSLLSNCDQCSDIATCSSCNPGYGKTSGSCVLCSGDGVLSCSGSTIFQCKSGYYLDSANNVCKLCSTEFDPNCSYCTSYSGCSLCNAGYIIDQSGTCLIPDPSMSNCETLVSGSTTQCHECLDGYYLSSGSCIKIACSSTQTWDSNNKVCKECSTIDPNCVKCQGTSCLSCTPGMVVGYNWNCVASSTVGCANLGYDPSKCTQCLSGYILNDIQGVCVQTGIKNCDTVSDAFTCTRCSTGYTKNCAACGSKPIRGCDCPSNDSSYCVKCKTDWFISGAGCDIGKFYVVCSSNCVDCSSKNVCTQCKPGYFLYDNNGVVTCICKFYLACTDSCNSCNPSPNCFECADLVVQDGSSCRTDQIGFQISFETPNIVIDFANSLSSTLVIDHLEAKDNNGNTLYTAGWSITSITTAQILIKTNLTESLLPIDVQFSFLQNSS